MNYLEQLLAPQQNTNRTFQSLESMIQSVTGKPVTRGEIVPEPIIEEKIIEKAIPKVTEKITAKPIAKIPAKPIPKPVEAKKINEVINEKTKPLNESATLQEVVSDRYKMYRDRDEIFECKVSVAGTTLSNATVRLICEAEPWNIVFYGKIYNDGRCVVPLKKMSVYPEGTVGKAKLEIILDDVLFVPWEEVFIVEGAKKVTVELIKKEKPGIVVKPMSTSQV